MYLKALSQDKADSRGLYGCPIYKTRQRGPTYVWTFNLKTKNKPQKWILAGVALIMQVWVMACNKMYRDLGLNFQLQLYLSQFTVYQYVT